jgi:SAM-dependent methyltransferase
MAQSRTAQSKAYLEAPGIHEQWESAYLHPRMEAFYERAFDIVAHELRVAPGERVLDAGCGYCRHAVRLARRGIAVTGVDFSSSALAAAEQHVKASGVAGNVELMRGDLLALPFGDGEFRAATCWGVLMHVPDLERALAELLRVVQPGGRVVLMENNADSWHVRLWEPFLRALKRVLGRKVGDRTMTPRGIEEWSGADDGGLLVRKTNIGWLDAHLRSRGATLVGRYAGQYTEIYVSLPAFLRAPVLAFNERQCGRKDSASRALGNILVFQRSE